MYCATESKIYKQSPNFNKIIEFITTYNVELEIQEKQVKIIKIL